MILGMIHLITHDETTLGAIEGQVLDDSKNTIITKEEDEFCQFISYRKISIHDSLVEVNQAIFAWSLVGPVFILMGSLCPVQFPVKILA